MRGFSLAPVADVLQGSSEQAKLLRAFGRVCWPPFGPRPRSRVCGDPARPGVGDRSAPRRIGLVDAGGPRPGQQLLIEALERLAVMEVPQVRQLVAERIHEARVLERLARANVTQPDPDLTVREADAVAALHVGPLGADGPVAQPEARGDPVGIAAQTRDEILLGAAVQDATTLAVGPRDRWPRGPALRPGRVMVRG